MLKALASFVVLVVMLGSGVAVAAWWLHDTPNPTPRGQTAEKPTTPLVSPAGQH